MFVIPLRLVLNSYNFGTKATQSLIDVLIATVYLLDIVNATLAFGRKSGNEQGDTRTDVRGQGQ